MITPLWAWQYEASMDIALHEAARRIYGDTAYKEAIRVSEAEAQRIAFDVIRKWARARDIDIVSETVDGLLSDIYSEGRFAGAEAAFDDMRDQM